MSHTGNHMRREAIRRTLAHRVEGAPDAIAVAEATVGTWHQMTARLEPVIGARGVEVLFGRSLHLTSKAYPWLSITGDYQDGAASIASFRERFQTREVAVATEASHALLVTVTELLVTLIGESLTERLLGAVWVPPRSESEQQTVP